MFGLKVSKFRKIAAGVMGLMMLVTLLLSVTYIIEETHHDCCGEDCPICATILQCANTVRLIGGGEQIHAISLIPVALVIYTAVIPLSVFVPETLVSRKVRLDH